jgi:hypothetical protein
VDLVGEELVEEEVLDVGVLVKGGLDVAQELASDDAASVQNNKTTKCSFGRKESAKSQHLLIHFRGFINLAFDVKV